MTTPAPSVFKGSSLFLHKSLNDFDQTQQLITELAALECLKIFISTFCHQAHRYTHAPASVCRRQSSSTIFKDLL